MEPIQASEVSALAGRDISRRAPGARRNGGLRARLAACLAVAALAVPAAAQEAPEAPRVPDLPTGDGRIEGVVVHTADPARAARIDVAVYALSPDGTPGLRGTVSDDEGRFSVDGVSPDPQIVYLVGAQYRGVPFGQRVTFLPGQSTVQVEVPVSDPIASGATLSLERIELIFEWLGTHIAVREIHHLRNDAEQVIFVPRDARDTATAPYETPLPEGASNFMPAAGPFDDAAELRDGRVGYWGPLYPGGQEFAYQYLLTGEGREVALRRPVPQGIPSLALLVPDDGLALRGEGLKDRGEVELGGRSYQSYEALDLASGRSLDLTLVLPEARNDPSAIHLPHVVLWAEMDDTSVAISAEYQLETDPGVRLMGSPDAPLLRIPLPPDAELLGTNPDSQALGLTQEPGGMALVGPLPAGQSTVAFRYRVPVRKDAVSLPLRFPLTVQTLDIRIADTGLVIDSDRLHRLRPARVGTRTYLLRQAFFVEPDETVRFELRRLDRAGLGRQGALAASGVGLLIALFFLMRPLSTAAGSERRAVTKTDRLRRERSAIYASIRDLEHDYETGKIEASDYEEMGAELRASAVDLLKRERAQAARVGGEPASDADQAVEVASPVSRVAAAPPKPPAAAAGRAAFCPSCGTKSEAGWQFCARCGVALPELSPSPAEHRD